MQTVAPEEVGLSSERLGRINTAMRRYIDQGKLAGAVTLVARHGKLTHFEAVGLMDIEAGQPMRLDSIFRIHSMTKPITAVSLMMLYEEGHFLLDDPVSDFIPEFARTKVFVQETTEGVELADLQRPITIRHLLMHTSGLPYDNASGTPVERLYVQEQIRRRDEPLAEKVRRIARLPLVHQPGSDWTYGFSHDVLGRVVEVISGKSFDVFLQERIFAPLGMVDTGFLVPREHLDRLVTVYTPAEQGGLRRSDALGLDRSEPTPFLSGGGGLVSTASDYARFCQMLLNGGELDGVRLLGRKTIDLMTADQLAVDKFPFAGHSMALGVATLVDVARFGPPSTAGSYAWAGAASTRFWIDPKEDLFGVVLMQFMPFTMRTADLFQVLTYQALVG